MIKRKKPVNEIGITLKDIKIELKTENIIKSCNNILKLLKIDNWEISVVICDDFFIRAINKEYRDKDESTDVLSFPQVEGESVPVSEDNPLKFYAGDIIISIETIQKNSSYFNVDINEEFNRVLIHGILHLKGMTHEDNHPEQEMLLYQEELLEKTTGVKIF